MDGWAIDGDDDVHNNSGLKENEEKREREQKNARTTHITHIGIQWMLQIHFDNVFIVFCHW